MRINQNTVNVAAQFDLSLANRLTDGTVSDVDLNSARNIYQQIYNNPPPLFRTPWGYVQRDPLQMAHWSQQVNAAQYLYREIQAAHIEQGPGINYAETAKDMGWAPQVPTYIPPPTLPSYDPGYTPPYVPEPTAGEVFGTVAGAVLVAAAFNAIGRSVDHRYDGRHYHHVRYCEPAPFHHRGWGRR